MVQSPPHSPNVKALCFTSFYSWTSRMGSAKSGILMAVLANLSSCPDGATTLGEKATKTMVTLLCKSTSPRNTWPSFAFWMLRILERGLWRGSNWNTMYLTASMGLLLQRSSSMRAQEWFQSYELVDRAVFKWLSKNQNQTITPTNHNWSKQRNEPITILSN